MEEDDMSVKHAPADMEPPGGSEPEHVPARDDRPLLTQRAAIILFAALITGLATGVLVYLATVNPAAAILAGGTAFGGAAKLLNSLIS
ncbi:MAG TPA: hypothetical protein VIF35_11620 [Streptosporangiaceae bacterium]